MRTANGRYYLLRILPYRTTRNIIDGVVITFVNISSQRRAEQLFHRCIEYLFIATIICDAIGEMQIVNQQAEQLFGWTRSELQGQLVEKLIPEAQREQPRQWRAEYIKSPRPRAMG